MPPDRWTGRIAFVRGVPFRSTSSGSIVSDSSTSANTGTAPARATDPGVAMNVQQGTITSWPGPTPAATRATLSAAVPDVTAKA